MSEYRYKAFISYRHLTLDKKVADKLQKLLEDYKVPKDLSSSKTNWRVFRDETELPTSNNLSDDIKDALHNSEFLIVLCSKETAKSRWCLEEITQFKELHNGTNENILTVLIEGDPNEVFPKELCVSTEKYINEDGTVATREVEVEPLAANIVADNEKASLKKLNTEYLRIVAPLLGCRYDDLYNRNYRKKMRRIAVVVSAVMVFLVMFSIYSGAMFMNITQKAGKIEELDLSIATKESKVSYLDGDVGESIRKIVEAFPEKYKGNRAVTDAEFMLAKEIGAFEKKTFNHKRTLKHNNVVEQIGYVGNGKNIVTKTNDGIYLWNASTGELIKTYTSADFDGYTLDLEFENKGTIKQSFINKVNVGSFMMKNGYLLGYEKSNEEEEYTRGSDFYISDSKIVRKIDGVTGETKWETDDFGGIFDNIYFVNDNIQVVTDEKIYFINNDDGSVLETYDISNLNMADFYTPYILYSTSAKCYVKGGKVGSENVIGYDIVNGKLTNPRTLKDNYSTILTGASYDSYFYSLIAHYNNVFTTDGDNELTVYDDSNFEEKWSYKFSVSKSGISRIGKLYAKNTESYCDIIFVVNGNKLLLFNCDNGELIHEYGLSGTVVELYYSENGIIYVITSDGLELAAVCRKLEQGDDNFYMLQTREFAVDPKVCGYYNRSYAVSESDSNEVYIYSEEINNDFSELYADEDSIKNVSINSDNSLLLINSYKELYVYDLKTQTVKEVASFDDYISLAYFIGNDKAMVLTVGNIYIYDLKTSAVIGNYSFESYPSEKDVCVGGDNLAFRGSGNKVTFCINGSKTKEWTPKVKSSYDYREYDDGYIQAVRLSNTGNKCFAIVHYFEESTRMEVFDVANGSSIALNKDLDSNEIAVNDVVWLSDETMAVLYDNNTFDYFDLASGECTQSFEINEDVSTVVKLIPIDDKNFVLVSDNLVISEFNTAEGTVSSRLDLKESSSDTKTDTDVDYTFTDDGKDLIFSSNEQAWVIDMDLFKARYYIDNYNDYDSTNNRIIIKEYNKVGSYPLYTTEELINKAKNYTA